MDVTLIAGAIVLLTITSFVGKRDHEAIGITFGNGKGFAFTPHQVACGTILTFGISAICMLSETHESFGYGMAYLGFGWLILSASVIALTEKFYKSKTGDEQK